MPLTDTVLRTLKPQARPRKLGDAKGLYIEVAPSGGKWWRLKYRIGGKEKRISLGVYPDIGLKEARDRRDDARRLVAQGIDPSDHRRSEKKAAAERLTHDFESVAREWFSKHTKNWAESHSGRMMRRLERDVFPHIGRRPIAEITAPELLSVARRIEGRTLDTAHRALRSCGQVFRYGVATGRCDRDPSRDLRGALPPIKKSHFAATTDPKRLGHILRSMDSYPGTLVVQSALKLAPLVFVRPGELRMAEWSQFDFNRAEWAFVASKTKVPHIVPLSRQAVRILKELEPLSGRGKYVFPGARSSRRPMSDAAVLVALRSMEIGADEMSGHGFRAVARTLLDEVLGFRADYIEHQLAHAVRDPHGRAYNRTTHIEERRKMMQAWADYLDRLKEPAEVVPFPQEASA